MKLNNIRRDYNYSSLTEEKVNKLPLDQFKDWLNEALNANISEATAMSLGTVGFDGFPQSRIVLLKEISTKGLVFFTNYNSSKGKAIEKNNKVSLHFYWKELERQVRILGLAERTSVEQSERYFNSRPPESQISAIISAQSSKIPSRDYLQKQYEKHKRKLELKAQAPKCPGNWGGYLVKPTRFQFWQGRENRLHDRIIYELSNNTWKIFRLAP